MKKVAGLLLLVCLLGCTLTSCQSPIKFENDLDSYRFEEEYSEPDMEFIGFKSGDAAWGDSIKADWQSLKDTQSIRAFGSTLQYAGVAIDTSNSYFGIYSFQEIKEYKNKKRYISFVELPDFSLTYAVKEGHKLVGAALVGLVITAPIGLLIMAVPPTTTMYLKSSANIYVYDSEKQEIVFKKNIIVNDTKEFKGNWVETPENARGEIWDYFAQKLANGLLNGYEDARKSPLLNRE